MTSDRYKKVVKERDDLRYELSRLKSIRQDSIANALNNSVKKALPGFSPDELTVEMKNGKVYVSLADKMLFKSGSAMPEEKGKAAIRILAAALQKHNDIEIMVEGHTDNVPLRGGQFKDNWDLSVARALNIVRLMTTEYKLDPARIIAAGRGEYSPVATNATSEGKAKNRRTELILTPILSEDNSADQALK